MSNNKKNHDAIEIIPYDPQWPHLYEHEASAIKQVLGDACLAIHHFGSTAIPGLSAKPKIDILTVINHFSSLAPATIEHLGFEYRGEVIPSGRYFTKQNPRIHLHIFEENNPLIERNLLFRDWLRSHPEDRQAYANLKRQLATQHTDGMAYCRAKTDFITGIINKAINNK